MPEPPSGGRSAGWLQRTRADLRKAGLRRTRCLDGLHRGLLRRDLGPIGSLPCLVTTELIVAGRFVHRVPAHDHVAHISSAFCAPAVPDRTVNRGWKWAASRQVASSMLSFSSPLPTSTIGWPSSVPIQNMYPRSRRTRSVCIAASIGAGGTATTQRQKQRHNGGQDHEPRWARHGQPSSSRVFTARRTHSPARARRPNPGMGGCAGR